VLRLYRQAVTRIYDTGEEASVRALSVYIPRSCVLAVWVPLLPCRVSRVPSATCCHSDRSDPEDGGSFVLLPK
jgi:hypothetical protein